MGVQIQKKKDNKVEVVQPKATITKEVKHEFGPGDKTVTEEAVGGEMLFVAPHCTVGVNISATIPTGKFANVKVGILLSMPSEKDMINETYEFAKAWCDGKLVDLTKDIVPFNG